ncbi:MarR family transcriptional regulator [bacterium]|nr:MAG: MarR family transcriptional regulator [bacterium]
MSGSLPVKESAIPGPPYVGALLRLSWQAVRKRLLRAFSEAGFSDIGVSHFAVIQYPPPDGVRPIEIAAKGQMSKQAANYLISQLEDRGYLERRTLPGKGRMVFLTAKGQEVVEVAHATMRRIEREWQQALGRERYQAFRQALTELGEIACADRGVEP